MKDCDSRPCSSECFSVPWCCLEDDITNIITQGRRQLCGQDLNINTSIISTPNSDFFAQRVPSLHRLTPTITSKMMSIVQKVAVLGYLASFALASPTKAGTSKRSPLDISLPPLIPAIPGVTEPLAST